jgi:mRNA interferase RelE/StbE
MYKVTIAESAKKEMQKIPMDYYKSIVKHIFALKENPRPFGYIKLTGFKNSYRIRVGVYRILYTIEDNLLVVTVIKVEHRSKAYQ